jgi:hypothetical protein
MPEHETIERSRRPAPRRRRPICTLFEVAAEAGLPIEAMEVDNRRPAKRKRRPGPICTLFEPPLLSKFLADFRGQYRSFNDACYLFYRSSTGPPAESDTPFASSADVDYSPPDTFADGIWYISVSYFNGVIDSGFLPLDDIGRTYVRLEIVATEEKSNSPGDIAYAGLSAPGIWRVEPIAGGVVRVHAFYNEQGPLRADDWCISYTTDGIHDPVVPPETAPWGTWQVEPIGDGTGLVFLEYDLPAQAHDTEVRVRISVRRDLGSYVYSYSAGTEVATLYADAEGPTAARGIGRWTGLPPQEV